MEFIYFLTSIVTMVIKLHYLSHYLSLIQLHSHYVSLVTPPPFSLNSLIVTDIPVYFSLLSLNPTTSQYFSLYHSQFILITSAIFFTMSQVRAFLASLRSQIDSKSLQKPFRFVTGNQSADLDSVISAISYSFLSHLANEGVLIPLINIPRQDLRLRRDIVSLMQSHAITEDLLYFVDDVEKLNGFEKTDVILVDHCNIQGEELTALLKAGKLDVVGIVDHHADEGVFLNASPRIIHSNGSCSSLVFNYWQSKVGREILVKNSELVELLLAPLLIDTSGMTQKVEQGDIDAFGAYQEIIDDKFNFIKSYVGGTSEDFYQTFYKQLKKAKKDMSGFSFSDILHKDYKQFTFSDGSSVGFSSIGKSLSWVLTKYDAAELKSTLANELKASKLDMLVITSSYTQKENDQYTREFCYYYETSNDTFDKLAELAKEPLQLDSNIYNLNQIQDVIKKTGIHIFNQVNIAASRKQVVPIVKEILESNR